MMLSAQGNPPVYGAIVILAKASRIAGVSGKLFGNFDTILIWKEFRNSSHVRVPSCGGGGAMLA